ADGDCTFREDKRVKRRLSRVASPVMHSKPMTAGNCFCTGSSILTGLGHCAASRKLSIQKTSVRGVSRHKAEVFVIAVRLGPCYCRGVPAAADAWLLPPTRHLLSDSNPQTHPQFWCSRLRHDFRSFQKYR